MDRAVEFLRVPEKAYSGRGIVICAGREQYVTCAWVCINVLRYLGCTLPIQVWHLDRYEVSNELAALLKPLGVECINAEVVRSARPSQVLGGWQLKPYSIIHCPFREVLSLDADNVPALDPTYLFDVNPYKELGSIFWPDYHRLSPEHSIWRLSGVAYRNEPEFESGQIVIDKSRCMRALSLAMWMNEHSEFWYRHILGDKETFHFAWRKLDQPYAMPDRPIYPLDGTMCQHDFIGRRVFQHRNLAKWSLGENRRVEGFEYEKECLEFVDQLRPHERLVAGAPHWNPRHAEDLVGRSAVYHRVGFDRRSMVFAHDGTIGEGACSMERFWSIEESAGERRLAVYGKDGLTAEFYQDSRNKSVWRGRWRLYEQMPVELLIDG